MFIDLVHYVFMVLYIILPFLLRPKYLIYYPIFFILLMIDWYDHDRACWLTKLSTYFDGSHQYSSNYEVKPSTELEGNTVGYNIMKLFGINSSEMNRADYYLLLLFSIPCIIAIYRVYKYYRIPYEPITAKILMIYFIFYLGVTYIIK